MPATDLARNAARTALGIAEGAAEQEIRALPARTVTSLPSVAMVVNEDVDALRDAFGCLAPWAERAISRLRKAGLTRRQVQCFVLIGYDGDTLDAVEGRLREVREWGGLPFAMLYRDESNTTPSKKWRRSQRLVCRPAAIFGVLRSRQSAKLIGLKSMPYLSQTLGEQCDPS